MSTSDSAWKSFERRTNRLMGRHGRVYGQSAKHTIRSDDTLGDAYNEVFGAECKLRDPATKEWRSNHARQVYPKARFRHIWFSQIVKEAMVHTDKSGNLFPLHPLLFYKQKYTKYSDVLIFDYIDDPPLDSTVYSGDIIVTPRDQKSFSVEFSELIPGRIMITYDDTNVLYWQIYKWGQYNELLDKYLKRKE